LLLLKKKYLVQQQKKETLIIDQKLKSGPDTVNNQSPEITVLPSKQNNIGFNSESVQMYVDFINEGYNIAEIIEEISNRSNAKEIIASILLVYIEELKTWRLIQKESNDSCSLDAKREIERIKEIISNVKIYSSIQETEAAEEDDYQGPNYNVTFYRSPSGNNGFFSDIQNIDRNSYKIILTLFQSILSGQLISYKKVIGSGALRGMKEVKMNNCRIAFLIENGYCIILSVFVKKANVDMVIYNNIAQRISLVNKNKKNIIEQYNEEEINAEIAEILSYLDNYRIGAK